MSRARFRMAWKKRSSWTAIGHRKGGKLWIWQKGKIVVRLDKYATATNWGRTHWQVFGFVPGIKGRWGKKNPVKKAWA